MIGGGRMGTIGKGTTETITATRPKVYKDNNGFPLAEFRVDGNLYLKGGIKRLRPRP